MLTYATGLKEVDQLPYVKLSSITASEMFVCIRYLYLSLSSQGNLHLKKPTHTNIDKEYKQYSPK